MDPAASVNLGHRESDNYPRIIPEASHVVPEREFKKSFHCLQGGMNQKIGVVYG